MNKVVQGLESYSYNEIVGIVGDFIIDRLLYNNYSIYDIYFYDIELCGSRLGQYATPYSDLDVIVKYDGSIREDDLFSMLNNEDPLYRQY